MGLVDPRVHATVAGKRLPIELLDICVGWTWVQDDEAVHELDVHTDGAASLNDV